MCLSSTEHENFSFKSPNIGYYPDSIKQFGLDFIAVSRAEVTVGLHIKLFWRLLRWMNERCACMWHRYSIFTLNSQPQQLQSKKTWNDKFRVSQLPPLSRAIAISVWIQRPRLDVEMEVPTIWGKRGPDTLMEVFLSRRMNESINRRILKRQTPPWSTWRPWNRSLSLSILQALVGCDYELCLGLAGYGGSSSSSR